MATRLWSPVRASRLSEELGLRLLGPDREVSQVCSLEELSDDGLSFALSADRLEGRDRGAVFAAASAAAPELSLLLSPRPRLDFIRAQHILERKPGFMKPTTPPAVHASAALSPHAVIEDGVSIGEGTVIGAGAVIKTGTHIGRCCQIKPGAVIGEEGFGFERDESGRPLRMIHLGGVRIGDHVDVGSHATVNRGALGDTVIESYVKLSDHVHVAHNCRIGAGSIIAGGAVVCGSVTVGKGVWLSPHCTVRQKVTLGDGCVVGLGAVVLRGVEAGSVVYGVPARPRLEAGAPAPPAPDAIRLN